MTTKDIKLFQQKYPVRKRFLVFLAFYRPVGSSRRKERADNKVHKFLKNLLNNKRQRYNGNRRRRRLGENERSIPSTFPLDIPVARLPPSRLTVFLFVPAIENGAKRFAGWSVDFQSR